MGKAVAAPLHFSQPMNLGAPVNTEFNEWNPYITPDGLTLYFESDRPGGSGQEDIWVSTRASVNDPFGTPVNLGGAINTALSEFTPALSSDGKTLLFAAERPDGFGSDDIYVSTRASVNDPFGIPVNLGPPVNTDTGEFWPRLSSNDLTLYFTGRNRPGGFGANDIWLSNRNSVSDPFEEPVNLGALINSEFDDLFATISPDGLMLLLTSNRPGGFGQEDIWVSTRASANDPFGTPVNLGNTINSAFVECQATLVVNTLFFCSDRPEGFGGGDIWISTVTTVPESTSTLGFLTLGAFGVASTLKRKLKYSKSVQKETTKNSNL
jgi:Tol biopolymer transport system component